jgi:hypothetical protein
MPNPSLLTQCASFFTRQGNWSVPEKGPFAESVDTAHLLVFEAPGPDWVFLSPLDEEEGVRIFRAVGGDCVSQVEGPAHGGAEQATEGWVWLHDEWNFACPSVMFHPGAGALGFVLDLAPADLTSTKAEVGQDIAEWLAKGDSLIAQLATS